MAKLPEHMVKRGRSFYFRKKANGRDVRISLGTNFENAKDRLRSLIAEDSALLPAITLRETADRWLRVYVPTARGERDHALAAQRMKTYLLPNVGHMLLRNLKPEHVRSYRLRLEDSNLSPQSVRHVLSDFRCMLNWCEDEGLLDRSPFPRRVMPRVQERPPDRLTEAEAEAVCGIAAPFGPVCSFIVETGLRWSEALRADTADVTGGVLVVHQTKSGKVRRVPLSPVARTLVAAHDGRIVPVRSHSYLTREVRKRSGVAGFHLHQLRHTFACRWLERGGSLAALQQVLGHSSVVTTQRYAKLGDAHVAAEAARIFGEE